MVEADLTVADFDHHLVGGDCLACIAYFATETKHCTRPEMLAALIGNTHPTAATSVQKRKDWWTRKLSNIRWAFRAAGLHGSVVHGRLIPEITAKGLPGNAGAQGRIARYAIPYFRNAPDRCRSLAESFLIDRESAPPVLLAALVLTDDLLSGDPVSLAGHDACDDEHAEGYALSEFDSRKAVLRHIRLRRGQQRFRDALRRRYGDHCVVTGCDLLDVVEAAHIRPFRGDSDHHPENGILLRADMHTLFDLGLLSINPTTWTVWLHPRVRLNYPTLHGKAAAFANGVHPSQVAMRAHFEAADTDLPG